MIPVWSVYLAALLWSASAQAASPVFSLSETLLEHIAAEPEWHQLLHYYPNRLAPWRFTSHVDDARFFLAPDGKSNPESELRASIDALLVSADSARTRPAENTAERNNSPRCRFVERERWLRARLSLPPLPVPSYCRDYHLWRSRMAVHSLTLVFPAAYLNSPSSMFGHTLLRFDGHDTDTESEWLSWSLNFAADLGSDAEAGFAYAFKGVLGGYAGRFSILPYFRKIQTYGAIENRDIWEYRLNLDAEEIDRLVRHVWELRDIRFDYFFFRQNCSFRLLELLDYARPGLALTQGFRFTAIPADTVKAISAAQLVAELHYRPATGTLLRQRLAALDPPHRAYVEALARDPGSSERADFLALPEAPRQQIVAAANQLLIFRSRRKAMSDDMKDRRFHMLKTLARYPAAAAPVIPQAVPPEQGHDTRRLSLAAGTVGGQAYQELGIRLSYHDLLDRIDGYPRGAGIGLGDLSIRRRVTGETRVEALRLVSLRSLNLQDPLLGSLAWEVEAGLERIPWIAEERMSAELAGSLGRSAALTPAVGVYAMLGASLNAYTRPEERLYFNAHARLGTIASNRLGTFDLAARLDAYQRVSSLWTLEARQNIVLAPQQALRVTAGFRHYDGKGDSRFEAAYRWHF